MVSETYKHKVEYGKSFDVQMFEVESGTFGNPDHPESSWGTLTLELKDCNSGSASFNGKDGSLQFDF